MQPAPELCALLARYYIASAEGDADFLAQYVERHPDALVIGTDKAEWWQGGDSVIDTWGTAWRTRGGLPVVESSPQAFREGSIGWLADQARWVLPSGHQVPFRLTAIFRETEQGWRMIQAHYSVPIPNEQMSSISA